MVKVIFYARSGIASWVTRVWSRRRGQRLADVPSHVGILVAENTDEQATYYEAIVTGVHKRVYVPEADMVGAIYSMEYGCPWIKAGTGYPDIARMQKFLDRQVGSAYDFGAIEMDIYGAMVPFWAGLIDRRKHAWDCSRLVVAAMLVGGMRFKPARLPESPNDVLFLTRG